MSEPEDDQTKPWTIKNVPQNVREQAIMAADHSDTTIGEYVTQALREKLKNDRTPKLNTEAIKQMLEAIKQMLS